MIIGIMYLNRRKGRVQAEIALQIGSEEGADVVGIAEALADQERRPTYGTYDLRWNSKYISVFMRKHRQINIKGKGG